MGRKRKKSRFNPKWSLIWVFIHSISLYISGFLLNYFNITDGFYQVLFMGFGVTIFAKIARMFTANKKFIVDKWLLFWVSINTITIWLVFAILYQLNNIDPMLNIVLTAIGLILAAYFVRRFKIYRANVLVFILLTFIILYIVHGSDQPTLIYSGPTIATGSENIFENFFSSISKGVTTTLGSGCPQINVPMDTNGMLDISGKSYDGWIVKGPATCRQGTKEGENLNKYYCGGYYTQFGISTVNAYAEKTMISKDGNIGKTYKHVIWNIYDEDKNFLETRCLGNPDEFERKQAEAFYKELQNWN